MTTTSAPPDVFAATDTPGRRTLVGLAVVVLVSFVAMLVTGADNQADAPVTDLIDSYDYSQTTSQVSSYFAMVFCAVLLLLGVATRAALRGRSRPWFADIVLLGFGVISLTVASWAVTALAMWHAVDIGDETMIRTANLLDSSGFLPLMCGMICVYVGGGATGLKAGTLPKWLAVPSIVLGVIAPLGPLGFVSFMLLPVWIWVVAVVVRLEPATSSDR